MTDQKYCSVCSYQTSSRTPAQVAYAFKKHSCEHRLKKAAAKAQTVRDYQARGVERDCTHLTYHEHGTNARAALDGCLCQLCRDAAYLETKRWRSHVAAHGHVYVDATPARDHIRALQAAGMGWKRAARQAGVANTSVYSLIYGMPNRNGGQPRMKARQSTIDKILAVPMPTIDTLGATAAVPSLGTRRRLQALATLGWSIRAVAARAGLRDRQTLDRAMSGPITSAGTARKVRDLYDQLWDIHPTASTGREQAGITRTRNHAAKQGWAPPAAYDDIDHDTAPNDPPALPQLRGGRPGVDLDEYMHLIRGGVAPTAAATRLNSTLNAVEKAAYRHNNPAVLTTLIGRRAAA